MFFWNSYPFIRLAIVLISGILCFDLFPQIWTIPVWALGIEFAFYSICIFFSSKYGYYKFRYLNGFFAFSIIFFIGGYLTKSKYHEHRDDHYLNSNDKIKGFSGIVFKPANERKNHYRYDLKLKYVIGDGDSLLNTSGKIHLYIRKDSLEEVFQYGDHLQVIGNYFLVQDPGNPNEFNYKRYLERQNIYSHAFVESKDVELAFRTTPNWFLQWAYNLRSHAKAIIDEYIPSPRENGIATAILLGIKDHLDNEIKKAYSSAGAMHVLAVSGLHVGIIFLIIKLLFGKLKETGQWGKYAFGIMSVGLIWLYAMITGLSPSVLRASTMFSLVALGESTGRDNNIFNSLGVAAFILLAFEPYLIYSVGFQLSFAAVFGIVYFQPKLYSLFDFQHRILDKVWAITCVSIAAQLSTFPLTAYYFHQFPTYFLISNIVVIPSSFLMLVGGISMIALTPISPVAARILGTILQKLIWVVNEIISFVHLLPHSLIEWIYLDTIGLVLVLLILFTGISGLHFRSFKTLIISTILALSFFSWMVMSNEIQSKRHELIFYDISNQIAIDHIQGHSAKLIIDEFSTESLELLSHQIDPHRLSSHLRPIKQSYSTFKSLGFIKSDVFQFGIVGNQRIIFFDSTTFHLQFERVIETDIVVINNGAVKSLQWLKENFDFELVILSSKNSFYYSRIMKRQAEALGIDIHSIREDGALRYSLDKGIKKERTMQPAPFTTNPD